MLAAGWYFSARRDDSGQIANVGDMQVQDLRVGDCFDLKDPDAVEVAEVEAKPCTNPHEYELFHVANMPDGEFPADPVVTTFVEAECVTAFSQYVGIDYQQSALYFSWFAPSDETWSDGDRAVQCAAYDPENTELTSSVRNAAR
ncbi:MAG TPA: septum formation family protein [Candidatus Limnocylindria bacterium]|nr:septum formation family protein [Candidatus Limnocylindria bacterium]